MFSRLLDARQSKFKRLTILRESQLTVVTWHSEEMTKAWEDSKLGLTREYKKRHREAVKKQKRGFAAAPGDE